MSLSLEHYLGKLSSSNYVDEHMTGWSCSMQKEKFTYPHRREILLDASLAVAREEGCLKPNSKHHLFLAVSKTSATSSFVTTISPNLRSCGLHPSVSKCVSLTFKRRSTPNYGISADEIRIAHLTKSSFLGVTLYSSLAWTHYEQRLNEELCGWVLDNKMICVTKWDCFFSAFLRLYHSPFIGLLIPSLLVHEEMMRLHQQPT